MGISLLLLVWLFGYSAISAALFLSFVANNYRFKVAAFDAVIEDEIESPLFFDFLFYFWPPVTLDNIDYDKHFSWIGNVGSYDETMLPPVAAEFFVWQSLLFSLAFELESNFAEGCSWRRQATAADETYGDVERLKTIDYYYY